MIPKQFKGSFKPSDQPGYETRFVSMDSLVGPKIRESESKLEKTTQDQRNLIGVFKSGQVPQLLPSYYTRLKKAGKV